MRVRQPFAIARSHDENRLISPYGEYIYVRFHNSIILFIAAYHSASGYALHPG